VEPIRDARQQIVYTLHDTHECLVLLAIGGGVSGESLASPGDDGFLLRHVRAFRCPRLHPFYVLAHYSLTDLPSLHQTRYLARILGQQIETEGRLRDCHLQLLCQHLKHSYTRSLIGLPCRRVESGLQVMETAIRAGIVGTRSSSSRLSSNNRCASPSINPRKAGDADGGDFGVSIILSM
jgi:hypothetical protein